MSLWHIAWAYLWNRKLPTLLTIVSVGLGVGLIVAVLTLRSETQKRFEEEGQTFDMVVGAKGSALQLVLCAVYFMDRPPGNISTEVYQQILEEDMVRAAFPIGIGDSFRGFPIVGTTANYFEHERINYRDNELERVLHLAEGRPFEAPMEIVLGSHVARITGAEVGEQIVGTHGFIELSEATREAVGFHGHDHQPYTVVGILEPSASPNDRALFTNIQSVWAVHDDEGDFPEWHGLQGAEADDDHDHVHDHDHDHDTCDGHDHMQGSEITAVLVQLESAADRFTFKDLVNREYNAAADIPIQVIEKLYDQLLSTAKLVLLAVGYLVVVVSALSILIGLYLSIIQRKRDLAIMRALGASAYEIFGAVLIEAFWVTLLGIGLGWLLGAGVTLGLSAYLTAKFGMALNAFVLTGEMINAFAIIVGVGFLAGILPAWQAYRSDVARDLAEK
jgi:putative ABC transport system permease protein